MKLPLIIYAGSSLLWLMFFVTGCVICRLGRQYSLLISACVCGIGLVASFIESNYLLTNFGGGAGIKPSSFIFSAGMCWLLLSSCIEKIYYKLNHGVAYFFEYLGKNSFALYLLHIIIKGYVFKYIPDMRDHWMLSLAVVLFLTVMVIEMIKKVVPSKYSYYLGIYC